MTLIETEAISKELKINSIMVMYFILLLKSLMNLEMLGLGILEGFGKPLEASVERYKASGRLRWAVEASFHGSFIIEQF